MLKQVLRFILSSGICASAGCGPAPLPYVPLNQADAVIAIRQPAGATEATVVAEITNNSPLPGSVVVLEEGQAVSVNGQTLSGPDASGEYARTISAATTYTVTVNEPTRGVQDTTIAAAGPFAITAPLAGGAASLSGFTITWSNPDSALKVRVRLTQTIFGAERTRALGPFTDTGSLLLSADDLRSFQQGANLLITVTRVREVRGINGFRSGTLSAELSQAVTVSPGA